MDRDGIAGEGVYRDHIELLRWLALERQASIAQQYLRRAGAIPEESEAVAGDIHNQRIDLIKLERIASAAIGSLHSRTESNQTRPHRTVGFEVHERPAHA